MLVLYLLSVAVHLALSWRMVGPVIQGDEGAYLGTGSLLAKGTGLLFRESPFQPGYGAVLWPVEQLTNSATVLYRSALILNALAMGSLVVIVYVLSRWLVSPDAIGQRLAVAGIVAAYPPFLAYSNVVLEINVFVPLCALTALALARCAQRPTWQRWSVAGLIAGASYGLHALGVVVVCAVIALALLARRPLHERLLAIVGSLGGMQVGAVTTVLLLRRLIAWDHHIAATATAPVVNRYQAVLGLYNHNGTVHSHALLFTYEAIGQVWYLATATLGLAVVGGVIALQAAWRVFVLRSRQPGDFVAAFAGLVTALGLVSAADRFIVGAKGTGQADALIYGRYNEHLLAPLLAVGVAYVVRRAARWRDLPAWSAVTIVVIAGCGWLLVHGRSAAALRAPVVFVNVMGLQPVLRALGRVDVVVVSVGAVLLAVLVLALAAWRGPAVLAPLLIFGGLASGAYSASSMVADSRARAEQRVVIHALGLVDRVAGVPSCVGYDAPVGMEWTLANDQTFWPRTEFKPFDAQSHQAPCSELVVTARNALDADYPGAQLMALENYAPTDLWVLPGPILDRLAAAGLLLPPAFPAPLPAGAYASSIAVIGAAPTQAASGANVRLRVEVTNRGNRAPWPSQRGFTKGDGWVSIAVAWTPVGAPATPAAGPLGQAERFQLDRELWPGETESKTLLVPTESGGHPLAPGAYRVSVGLVQEGYSYFADRGDAPLQLLVTIR